MNTVVLLDWAIQTYFLFANVSVCDLLLTATLSRNRIRLDETPSTV